MTDKRIEIRFDSEEGFKKGMRELKEQISYLTSRSNEIDELGEELQRIESKALSEYCNEMDELQSLIYYIPEHLVKKER